MLYLGHCLPEITFTTFTVCQTKLVIGIHMYMLLFGGNMLQTRVELCSELATRLSALFALGMIPT